MKTYFYGLLFLFSCSLFSCEKNDTEIACDITDPVNNLPWLKAKVDSFVKSDFCENNACSLQIYKVSDGNRQLLVTWVYGPAVDGRPQYYTCSGKLIICTGEEPCPNLNTAELIWTSKS
jgi:hypothetical protein